MAQQHTTACSTVLWPATPGFLYFSPSKIYVLHIGPQKTNYRYGMEPPWCYGYWHQDGMS
jgi:hypothetical protein